MAPYKNRWFKKETKSFSPGSGLLTVYRCPAYIPSVPTGKKRLIQEFTFLVSSLCVIINLLFKQKIKYAIGVAPPFHTILWARLYKFFKGSKVIYHIQDLQIDTAQELGMVNNETFFSLLYQLEKRQLKGSDFVSSISEGMIKKIKSRADRDVIFFPNWVDTKQFFPLENRGQLKKKWGYDETQFICLYSGGLGEKQGLEIIVHTANLLKENIKFKFIICGFGQYKSYLENLAASLGLQNVDFLPLQDKGVFNEFLNIGDLHLVVQRSKASDLALPSKLASILSVGGVSLVTAAEGSSMYNLVTDHDVGFTCLPDDPAAFANALINIYAEDLSEKRKNASAYASKFISIENVVIDFINKIDR
jgi:colanic acid biosynthesis glycosyl transferase WcaI